MSNEPLVTRGRSAQGLVSVVFIPVAVAMGVDLEDAPIVARLVAVKTVYNEARAFQDLSHGGASGALSVSCIASQIVTEIGR